MTLLFDPTSLLRVTSFIPPLVAPSHRPSACPHGPSSCNAVTCSTVCEEHTVVWNVIKATTRSQLLRGQHEPHDFQLDAATSVALGKDMILIAPTSSGKMLILAMPLLYHVDRGTDWF